MISALATNAKFGENAIFINVSNRSLAKDIAIAYEIELARWARLFGKAHTVLRFSGKELRISATLAMNNQSKKMEVISPQVFTGINIEVWDRSWLSLMETMISEERPQTLIRISDQRQIWCNQPFAELMRSNPKAIVQRKVSDYWLSSDLERLYQLLDAQGNFDIEYRAQLNDEGIWGRLAANNQIYELNGEFYRLSTNIDSEIIQKPVAIS